MCGENLLSPKHELHSITLKRLWFIGILLLLVAKSRQSYAKSEDSLKYELAPLSNITFDTSNELIENGLTYFVSIGDRFSGKPRFSIYPALHTRTQSFNNTVLAKAVWQDRMGTTGWNHLRINIIEDADLPDNHKSYAAGVLEGFLSRSRIREFFLNTRSMLHSQKGGPEAIKPVWDVFKKSVDRVKSIDLWDEDSPLNSVDAEDPVDQLVRLALLQIWGISDGYEAARKAFHPNELWEDWPKIDVVDMHFLSADGDIPDLKDSVAPDTRRDNPDDTISSTTNEREATSYLQTHRSRRSRSTSRRRRDFRRTEDSETYIGSRRRQYGRCSALVRLADDELFVGHSTWEPFSEMTRIVKFYDFPFKGVKARSVAFPSYPGAITSTDDFIITSAGLVLTETTIDIQDRFLFRERSNIREAFGSYSDFMKPIVASRLAETAREWVKIFEKSSNAFLSLASCQWMAVDYNKFQHGKLKNKEAFYVVEAIPGYSHSRDMTSRLLSRGYWSSSNRAWFKDIRHILKDDLRLENDTALLSVYSEKSNPRAFAFKHLAPTVDTLEDMKRLMQFSPSPPEAGGPPENLAIAPRFDLSKTKETPEGATDSKIIDSSLMHDFAFIGISGPEHQRNSAFSWVDEKGHSKWDENLWPHRGMISTWNFTWYLIDTKGFNKLADTSETSRRQQFEKWSEELAISVDRRNETRRRHRDDDDDDVDDTKNDDKDDNSERRRYHPNEQINDSRLEPHRLELP